MTFPTKIHQSSYISVGVTLFALVTLFWLWQRFEIGRDSMPLIVGARQIVAGESPYSEHSIAQVQAIFMLDGQTQCPSCARIGHAYPPTAMLYAMPVALLPLSVSDATFAFTMIGTGLLLLALLLHNAPPHLFLAVPTMNAFLVANPVIHTTALLLLAHRSQNVWLRAGLVTLAVMVKPPAAILIALWLLLPLVRQRAGLALVVPPAAVLFVSLAIVPNWIPDWLAQLALYKHVEGDTNGAMSNLWWLSPLAVLVWRRYPLAGVSLLNMALIPAMVLPYAISYGFIISMLYLERGWRRFLCLFSWAWIFVVVGITMAINLDDGDAYKMGTFLIIIAPLCVAWMVKLYNENQKGKSVENQLIAARS